jgi:hypothetical protein
MINKIVHSMAEAMVGIRDGAVVLIGGFGTIGQPNALIEALIEQGAKDLTVVANNAGVGHVGLARLMEVGRVRKIICSYPRTTDPVVFESLYRAGKIELEAARHDGRAHARRRRRHSGLLYADLGRHVAGGGKRGAGIPRPPLCAGGSLSRRRRADRSLGSGSLGQSNLQILSAEL